MAAGQHTVNVAADMPRSGLLVALPLGGVEGGAIDAVAQPTRKQEVAHGLGRFAAQIGTTGGREPGIEIADPGGDVR